MAGSTVAAPRSTTVGMKMWVNSGTIAPPTTMETSPMTRTLRRISFSSAAGSGRLPRAALMSLV